jgi:phosphinothricin acetyltransferase
MIRPVSNSDAPAICALYNPYVIESIITFEEVAVTPDEIAQRIGRYTETLPWYAYEINGALAGYAYAAPWKPRSAYRFAVESTVFVAPAYQRQGIGLHLLQALITELRSRGVHAVLAGIALPNPGSIAVHEKAGYEKVAHLRQVGRKFDRWIDVGYWELLL